MNIIKEIHSEDCFDGNFIKDYTLDMNITLEWVEFLKNFGDITLLDSLEKPFFSFDKKYFFTIKGIVGEKKIKVIFRRNYMDKTMDFLHVLLNKFDNNSICLSEIKKIEEDFLLKFDIDK